MHSRTVRHAALALLAVAALTTAAACAAPAAAPTEPATHDVVDASGAGAANIAPATFTTDTPASTPGQRSITVTANGVATGTPDTLTVQLGVQTTAKTAGAALKENNAKAAALIASLTKQGVAKKDLTTSDLSIYPSYSNNGNTITGYQVSNTVTAVLRDVAKAGGVIDAAARAAGDAIRLNQVGFSFDDDSGLRATARSNAVKQALAQANQLAKAAGVAVGPILSISEGTAVSAPQPMFAGAAESAADGAPMPVLAGEGQLTVTVQVVVSIG